MAFTQQRQAIDLSLHNTYLLPCDLVCEPGARSNIILMVRILVGQSNKECT